MRNGLRFAAFLLGGLATAAIWRAAEVRGQIAVRNQGYVPYNDAPIRYLSDDLNDPVARLQKRLEKGDVRLTWDEQGGYLKSVLRELAIPVSSQTLVFSRTSFQFRKISPATPRALYFNDDVYVGFVKNGKAIEVVSFDPVKGAIFYLLDAQKTEKPAFERAELDCTQCHIAAGTRGVPGVLLKSIYATDKGNQATYTQSFITGQESPLKERWGGWYVTGSTGTQKHMGNVTVADAGHPEALNVAAGANWTKLAGHFDATEYLSDQSDVVAHLVLAHQTQMHNLITQVSYQTRIAEYDAEKKGLDKSLTDVAVAESIHESGEALLRYLLFTNEAPLEDAVRGTTGYRKDFEALGPRDGQGRSLRDFDLKTRIFRYRCSYLIYSADWDALPDRAKSYLYHRLHAVLAGQDTGADFARLSGDERRAILEILRETKRGLPEEWRQSQTARIEANDAERDTRSRH